MANLVEKVRVCTTNSQLHKDFGISRAEQLDTYVFRLTIPEQHDRGEPTRMGIRMASLTGVVPRYTGTPQQGNVVPYTFNDGNTQVVVQLFYERTLPSEDLDFTK